MNTLSDGPTTDDDIPPAIEDVKGFKYPPNEKLLLQPLVDLPAAPEGYPGKRSSTEANVCPTLARMWPGGGQNWSAYQPPPTMTPGGVPQWAQQGPPSAGNQPKKRALICGINYLGTSAQLNGCINDARCMQYMLKSKFNFNDSEILLMTDDHPDPLRRPTRYNMFQGFTWLMTDLRPGDSLVFHYSGHGGQQRDYSGEEDDGMNETLCPMDFQTAGEIVDDDLNRFLVNPLPQGVKLHAIIDACHSGSVLDLPYQATVRQGYASWNSAYSRQTRSYKGTAGGFAVQFSAAKDSQTAADTAKLSGGVATGAATFCFIKAVEELGIQNVTYGDLLLSMSRTLQQAGLGGDGGQNYGGVPLAGLVGGGIDGFLASMLQVAGGGAQFRGQEPVLSANYAFDLGFKFNL